MSSYAAATGLEAATKSIEVCSHNIANSQTNGYKRQFPVFSDLAYTSSRRVGEGDSELGVMQFGSGVAVVGVSADFMNGELVEKKGQPFSMAVIGEGFFVVTKPDGTLGYTRDGNFTTDAEGKLVASSSGYQLGQEAVYAPGPGATDITVKEGGLITAKIDGVLQEVGNVELAGFLNPTGLKRIGHNLYEATEASGEAVYAQPGQANMGLIRHEYLEASNVNPITEILQLTKGSHLYNYSLKAFEISQDTEKRLVDVRL